MILSAPRPRKAALRKMDHDQFAHAQLQQRTGGVAEGNGVQRSVVAADFKTGGHPRLIFIYNAVVGVCQRRGHYFFKSIAVLADTVDAGL